MRMGSRCERKWARPAWWAAIIAVMGSAWGAPGNIGMAPEGSTRLPEVTVVADRGATVPDASSLTVLDTSVLPIGNQASLGSLSGLAPNLSVAGSGVRGYGDVTTMRGTANTPFFSSPGTVVYLDDVPLGPTFAQGGWFWGSRAIDVLRGPRATAFGFNAPGGVIRVRTPLPGNEHRASASASYGSFDPCRKRGRPTEHGHQSDPAVLSDGHSDVRSRGGGTVSAGAAVEHAGAGGRPANCFSSTMRRSYY